MLVDPTRTPCCESECDILSSELFVLSCCRPLSMPSAGLYSSTPSALTHAHSLSLSPSPQRLLCTSNDHWDIHPKLHHPKPLTNPIPNCSLCTPATGLRKLRKAHLVFSGMTKKNTSFKNGRFTLVSISGAIHHAFLTNVFCAQLTPI